MNSVTLKVKKLSPAAMMPTQGSAESAGWDLYACLEQDAVIVPGCCVRIPLGLACALPQGYFGAIFARSGLASKQGLRPANCVGVVDSDYRGEWMIPLYNDSTEPRTVHHGDRVAQLVVLPCPPVVLQECTDLDDTQRGAGGFGSTGL